MYDEAVVVNVFHVASLIFLKKVPMRKIHIVLQQAPAILARQTILHETALGEWSVKSMCQRWKNVIKQFTKALIMSQLALQNCGFNNVFLSEFNYSLHQNGA